MSEKKEPTKEELESAIKNVERQRNHMASQVSIYDIQINALKEQLEKLNAKEA